ncbi:S8 family serine peptidase [Thermococcus sp.]
MNKKALSLLLMVLMVISLVPLVLPSAEANTTIQSNQVISQLTKLEKTHEKSKISPVEKIEPVLFDILNGKTLKNTMKVNGQEVVMIYIVSRTDVSEKLKGIKIAGTTKIGGDIFYMGLLPVKKESIEILIKIASIPQVESITRINPVEPISIRKDSETVSKETITLPHSKFASTVNKWKPSSFFEGKKVLLFRDMISGKLMDLQKNSLARQGKVTIAKAETQIKNTPKPQDYFAIYHHGSWDTWFNLGITGAGVNVAVIDSGVDFGNPDLQDAYAVETNPDSPYYGWPIAFDGNSMLAYLLYGYTFADFGTFRGYLNSWYANTSYNVQPYLVYGGFGIGYKGNYTTVFTSMSLANIPDDTERTVLINNTLNWIGNVTNVLLVDDDGEDSLETFYKTALNNLEVNYSYYEVPNITANGPNVTVLSNYSLVIWFTGGTRNNTLTNADIGNLTQYLDNGGKLWLISDDYLHDGGLNNTTIKYNFTIKYLHVNASAVIEDYPVPTVIIDYIGNRYYGGEVYWGLYESPTDVYADYIGPGSNATILLLGFTAYAYDPVRHGIYIDIKLPLNKSLEVPTVSGTMKIGLHPDLALWQDWYGGFVLVTDPHSNQTYDTVYADIAPATVVDFNKDAGHTKDNPVIQLDFWNTFTNTYGQDGYADLSGGLIYFIADGQTPIPYSTIVSGRWGIPLRVPENGGLVAFMIGTPYTAGGDHGTLCAAAVAARGRTFFGLTFGNAIGAKIIAEGSLYQGGSWIDYLFFAVEGYDGIPGTGDEAKIASNSYGVSTVINKGYTWSDRFLYLITHYYSPTSTFFFAAGNGGPGYGTVTSEGASPFIITVGASVEWGYRGLFGYDDGPWSMELANYGDVADFSNRGPNALGQPDPDVLAVGEFALGSEPVNMYGDGFWASDLWSGTSLATPMAAGIAALVYEAYYETYGRWPTSQEVKEILMSTAENVNYDVFSQGAGFLNSYRAVKAAMHMDGIVVAPSSWQAGKTDYQGLANVLYPGESDTQVFEIENMNSTSAKEVNISAEVFQKIGEVEFDVIGNSWQYYPIGSLIPEGTDLMKVTLYTNYTYFNGNMDSIADAYPFFRVYDVTYVYDPDTNSTVPTLNLLQQSAKEGTVASAMIGSPLKKMHDDMWIQIRDILRYYGKTETYPAKVKLEFYKRVPWDWVSVDMNSLNIPANGSAAFTATLTVPENAQYGVYEGAIYLKYDGVETTIPVSVVVASPTPEFQFGGSNISSGLYDNSNIYGYMDWEWRYESGDWRLFYFNVPRVKEGTHVLADVAWDGTITDINLHLLAPSVDEWGFMFPDVMGPYHLNEIARSDDGYLFAGIFKYQTTSGHNEELIAGPAVEGLNALWLHNVVFDGNASFRTFYGHVGLATVSPQKWIDVLSSQTGEKTFTVDLPKWAGNPIVRAFGLSVPLVYQNVLAPPTESSDFYTVNVTNSPILDVKLNSIYDDLVGLDLDLYVYYNQSGTLMLVGASYTSSADEEVKLNFPTPGQYVIEVNSYNNPAPGEATYNLKIITIEGNELQIENITEENDKYKIKVKYNLTPEHMTATESLQGMLFVGTDKNPLLFQIPVVLSPSPYDISIEGVNTSGIPELGSIYNITLYITNHGPFNATNIKVLLYRDGAPVEVIGDTLSQLNASETYKLTLPIPIADSEIHTYKVVIEGSDDLYADNNYIIVRARPEQSVETAKIMESIGYAAIRNVSVSTGSVISEFETDEGGAVVTIYVHVPLNGTFYSVSVTSGEIYSYEFLSDNVTMKIVAKVYNGSKLMVAYGTQEESPVTPKTVKILEEQGITAPVFVGESEGGTANIEEATNITSDTQAQITVKLEGTHKAITTLYIILPKDIVKYSVKAIDADVISTELTQYDTYSLLTVKVQLHSPGEIYVEYLTPSIIKARVSLLNYIFYMKYLGRVQLFDKLYEQAVAANISNDTIQKALSYRNKAVRLYETVALRGLFADTKAFVYLRQAYLDMDRACKILEKALKG